MNRLPVLLAAAASLAAIATAHAAAERTFSPLVRGQVPAGEAQGAAATSRGTITVAPAAKELAAPPAPYLWSLAVRAGRIYAGSGDGGEVWEVPEDGGAAKSVLDPSELQAQALAVSGDALVVALNPGARIVSLPKSAAANGAAETVWDAAEDYAWAVLPGEGRDRALYVAVGSPGRVYRVEPGKAKPAEVVLESGDGHVRSLARAKDGRLLAGTDGRGLVMRVEKDGRRFVLFDAPRREISSLSVAADGTVWFSAVGAEEPDAPANAAPAPAASPTPADPKKGPPGQLYRMRPDGFAELVWQAPGPSIHAVLADGDGAFVATGDPAALWSVDAEGTAARVLDPSAGQAVALARDGKDVLVATANPSKVLRLAERRGEAGAFLGKPLDAGGFARWGRLRWHATRGDGRVEITTRSGNSAVPDDGWSAWSDPIPADGGAVASPPARFLQWRARITPKGRGAAPVLTDLELVYRAENRAPRVDWVYVEEPGITIAPKADAPPAYALPPETKPAAVRKELPAKRGFQRGWRAARWSASDPDGDDLVFDVFLRGEGETAWKALVTGLPESYTTWDAASLPDGRYEIRVVARDDAVNGAEHGRAGERVEGPFENDGTPPRVLSVEVRRDGERRVLAAEVSDAVAVAAASYAIDGGPWVLMSPADGIGDGTRERFEATLPALPPGEHVIVVRATDRAGNPGAGKTVLK